MRGPEQQACEAQQAPESALALATNGRGPAISFERLLEDTVRRVIREELAVALRSSGDLLPATPTPPAAYLTIAEAARVTALHDNTIRKWIKEGSLQTQRAGRVHRIKREHLEARIAGGAPHRHTSGNADIDARAAAILAKL
jgi:excisionase family DNA binding protein